MEHHPVFAEGDGPPVAIGRDVPDGEERHDESWMGASMIRADSTPADARHGSDFPQRTRTKRKRPANRGAPKLQSSDSHAAILAALPSRAFLAVVMGIARGFIASGTTRKRSTCKSPFSRLAPLIWTWSASWKLRSKFRSAMPWQIRLSLSSSPLLC